jgi:CRP-like cAMP-binding protein
MPDSYDLALLGLDENSEIRQLVGRFPDIQPRAYRDGEYLIRENEESQDIFIVLRGGLVVEQAPAVPGAPPLILACVLADLDDLAIVGEMACLGSQRRAASVKSSGRSHTLCLNPVHIDGILERFPGLTRVICRQFSRRLKDTAGSLVALQGRFALNPLRRMAEPGERLFAAGGQAGELFQLAAGSVRLERAGVVREVTPEDLPMGLLELEPFLRGSVHSASATVATPAFLAVIGQGEREAVVRCFPQLVLAILAAALSESPAR